MRCKLPRTRGLRSDGPKMRSTKSGPGRCRRSLEIFGEVKPRSESAFAPRSCWMELGAVVVAIALRVSLSGCQIFGWEPFYVFCFSCHKQETQSAHSKFFEIIP